MIGNFVATGIKGLDLLLSGGIPQHSSVIVEGAPGTGKTILAMQYVLQGAQQGEPGLYFTFEELPEQLYRRMNSFGWSVKRWQEKGMLRVISMDFEVFCTDLLETEGILEQIILQTGCRRLVIDSISLLKYVSENEKERRLFLYTLRNVLRKYGITSLFINEETSQPSVEHYVLDGVVRLMSHIKDDRSCDRTLRIEKMRGTNVREGEHLYKITENGIFLAPFSGA